MKLAIIGNFDKTISRESTGGSEMFTYQLATELAEKNTFEQVHVYGVGANHFSSKKIQFHSLLKENTRTYIEHTPLLQHIYKTRPDLVSQIESNIAVKLFIDLQRNKYDIIHDNSTSSVFNSLSLSIPCPILTTLHTNADSPSIAIPFSLLLADTSKKHGYVTIAKHQLNLIKKYNLPLNILGNIYNGIPIVDYSFFKQADHDKYGFWIGRISSKHNKGLKEAIIASNQSSSKLKIISVIDDQTYYDNEILPQLTKYIELSTGSITLEQKNKLYGGAKYLLYPSMWEEPFGLIFLESMASGTPIIAFARGASPEIIVDGQTGLLVNPSDSDIRGNFTIKRTGIEGLNDAIAYLHNLEEDKYNDMRANCRHHVEKNFSIKKMVDNYVIAYDKLISQSV